MKKRLGMKSFILLLIIILSLLLYFGSDGDLPVKNIFRLLYFIPIILAALNFGFRGGVAASLVVSLIYSPFILLTLYTFNIQTINDFLDILMFFTVGIITGTLVEKKNLNMIKFDDELKRHLILENYTNSIIESIKSGVIVVNNDMLITIANQGAQSIMGVGCECIGQHFTEAFSCCESIKDSILNAFLDSEANENIEVAFTINEKDIDIRISVYPLSFENIKKGLVIIIDDITDIKKLHKDLLRNEKLAALGELSTGVAHEIRNPLGIIKAIEQTMKKEFKDNHEAVKQLDIIDEEIERTNKVIKALMEFGRPPKDEKQLFSVDTVLEDVLTVANKYILQHGVKIQHNHAEDTFAVIDKELLKQAFVNIIFNAVQAMPHGGDLIISTTNTYELFVKISFEDTGIGISESNIEKIFNPFYTTKAEGTGLGLAIVNRIIEEHNGTISVSSKEGLGTSFEITLPTRRNDE
jgi:signal transduction histidine kinase